MSRCFGDGDALYEAYHDEEWGRPVTSRDGLFERVSLEAFQSGLAWITILRKREAFRRAFADFDPEVVARFGDDDVARLLGDAGIVRNRAKIVATIANARAIAALEEAGDRFPAVLWSFAPPERAAPSSPAEIPSSTTESAALARELKRLGFRFVGPITAYALMQAAGIVNDHLAGCPVRADVEVSRRSRGPAPP